MKTSLLGAISLAFAVTACSPSYADEAAPVCKGFDAVKTEDAALLHSVAEHADFLHVLVADLQGQAAQNADEIMLKLGAPESVMRATRVVIFTGEPPKGSKAEPIGNGHLFVFDSAGCFMGGADLPIDLARRFAGLDA
jgi:hypothetical protein